MEGSDVQNQVPDPTSRDQTSQEEWCSEGKHTHTYNQGRFQ